ncbi:immunity 49 family protein [Nocardiopsis lucentensis]|uniref:immunity 49 family protein n=1 Tax=Nocardiopsis lucentensis TaxID=53441 RepID=UPI000475A196|nr:immunity 49 family protein [Nocardiopsis lucentensis]
MNHRIFRHDLSRPDYVNDAEEHAEETEEEAASLETHPQSVDMSLSPLYLNARIDLVLDPEAVKLGTWESWVGAMQVHHAMFVMTTRPEGTPVEFLVNHKIRRTTAIGPRYCANASNWLTAFALAMTCRDEKRWTELCEIPVDSLREWGESDGAQYDPYVYHWIAAIQAFLLNRSDLADELQAAFELSDPGVVRYGSEEAVNKVIFPPMKVFLQLVGNEPEEFNSALAEGLELWRDYFTSDEKRAKSINGAIPLLLLAFACMAYDISQHDPGFQLEVESDFLPKHIVQNSWYGQFPI